MLVRWEVLSGSPARDLKRLPEVKTRRVRYYTEEIQTIQDAAAATELAEPMLLALYLGLRAGEIVPLTVSDVDFKNRLVHIQATPEWRPNDHEERSLETNEEVCHFLIGWLSRPERTLSPTSCWGCERSRSTAARTINSACALDGCYSAWDSAIGTFTPCGTPLRATMPWRILICGRCRRRSAMPASAPLSSMHS